MASSSAFVKARDVLPEFKGWLRDLDIEQTAAATKEKATTRQDHAQIIAKALVRYGVSINSGVQDAIDTMQRQQEKVGDTIDLAIVMSHLPQQWSQYRVALQQNGRAYFQQHSSEIPNFMKLYFKSITFFTLWNDVWIKHVGLLGGRELVLLKSVQQWLLELDKPSAKEAAAEEKAQLWKPPSQTFLFNSADIKEITAAAEKAAKAQEQQQTETMKQLRDAAEATHKLHIWLRNTEAEALNAAERPANVPGQFILQDGQTKPIQDLKAAIRLWCQKILEREYLFNPDWIEQIIGGVVKKRGEHWAKFEKLFESAEWRAAYKAHILADVRWTRALRIYKFIKELRDDEQAPPNLKQMANAVQDKFTALHVHGLQEANGRTQIELLKAQQALMAEVAFHDTTRYQLWVLQTCAALIKNNDGHAKIKDYLKANADAFALKREGEEQESRDTSTPIERAIGQHAIEPYQPDDPNMFCKALIKLKNEKESIRANIHRSLQLGQVDPVDDMAEEAATACRGIAKAMLELAAKEKDDQNKHIMDALDRKPPLPLLGPTELFLRSLAPLYANEGRRRLHPIFKSIEDKNILFELAKKPIDEDDKDNPTPAVMPWVASKMLEMDTDKGSSSFDAFIRYALWLMWVLHQEAVRSYRTPLTSDPHPAQ